MSEKPDLWMPLYFGAYLTDTMHLTTEQHGTYFLLLIACWKAGGVLPNDDKQLAAIAKLTAAQWRKTKPIIAPFWRITAHGWSQKRLSQELNAARERTRIATENGKKGGRPRKAGDNPDDNPEETQKEPAGKANDNPDESSVPLPRPLPKPRPGPEPRSGPKTTRAARLPDGLKILTDLGVAEQAAKDWLTVRRAKKAPLTETAIEALKAEAEKAGITVAKAVTIAAERGWQGFKADWLSNSGRGGYPERFNPKAANAKL